ncbi:CPBP family intramembrane metalloprotease [Bacillus cereus]|uniref:CPBP family intramembrane glutamic endopeptidase n=1 Tax=Bacillus cereus TaxID=1396 RepID=UPI0010BD5BDF|nr:CPBP family intramembrane glutamic endopeptidase [Bacillus cereus]TKI35481.1 CPBP family intramembrane metalloprotease [Bacillus cereus]
MHTNKQNNAILLLILTIVVGITYYFLVYLPIKSSLLYILGIIWNAMFAGTIGYILLRKDFTEQFKHFSWKTLAWGLPLTLFVGISSSLIYQAVIGPTTTNSIGSVITLQMILLRIPFMILGEELLSTNILLALEKKGISFMWASIICAILFALWHVPAYGWHPLQLICTLAPTRLALNYVWKKSNSVWVSLACHFLFDCITFIQFFVK